MLEKIINWLGCKKLENYLKFIFLNIDMKYFNKNIWNSRQIKRKSGLIFTKLNIDNNNDISDSNNNKEWVL